jgi:hypothetical protein
VGVERLGRDGAAEAPVERPGALGRRRQTSAVASEER